MCQQDPVCTHKMFVFLFIYTKKYLSRYPASGAAGSTLFMFFIKIPFVEMKNMSGFNMEESTLDI